MKKRILTILLLTALLPAVLLLAGLSLPEYYGESYYGVLSGLYERLRAVEGKKIVVIGGSNVAFGVDGALLERLLAQQGYEYTVCNFGLYGAVGIDAMLELAEPELGEGDIAVLAIEPTSESFSMYFGATAFWKCAESDSRLILPLSAGQKSALAGNYPEYLQDRLAIRRSGILPAAEGAYARSAFDSRGDMVFDRPGNGMPLGYDTGYPIDLEGVVLEPAFAERVNAFAETAARKGASAVMSFCPMNRGAVADISEETVYGWFTRLQETFACRVISNPNDYLLESGWFYDSNFHLNSAGMAVRTYRLACDLLNYLGDYREVPFDLPEMPPAMAQTSESEGDPADFRFEPLGETGLLVSGLTERGMEKESLLLPSAWEGKPVVGMTEDAFAGNTRLTELILPATVESIPDGAFRGCVNLKKLTLLHSETPPAVGEGLLKGAEKVTIFVPAGAYRLYRDGAGCAANPWEMYLSRMTVY